MEKTMHDMYPEWVDDDGELTRKGCERQDLVDGAIQDLLEAVAPEGAEIEYDGQFMFEIRRAVQDVIVEKLGLMTAMEFYPYIE